MNDKRPLRIRFETARSMFGSNYAATDWSLIAAAIDHSLMRQPAAYFLGSLLDGMDFSPTSHFLHLYMDGEYRGVYFLTDQIHVHPGRVELTSSPDPTLSEYFLQWCIHPTTIPDFIAEYGDIPFVIEFPDNSIGYREFVEGFMGRVGIALSSLDIDKISEVIDICSFIDFYLVHELFKNMDQGSSFYMQVRQTDTGPKLFGGPLWDFDQSSGNQLYSQSPPWGFWDGAFVVHNNRYFNRLMITSEFKEQVSRRWGEIRGNEVATMMERIRQLSTRYQACFEHNFYRWPDKNVAGVIPQELRILPFIEQVDFLTNWFQQRKIWMDYFLGL